MKSRAFTLIELLVVISIIGLLSSTVLAALNVAREKGRIASAAQFVASTYHALAPNLLGGWLFEEGSSTLAVDFSGNGRNGTLVSSSWSSDTYGTASKYSMSYAGAQYVRVDASLGMATGDFSISQWIKTTETAGQRYTFSNTASADGFRFGISGGRIAFLIGNGTVFVENSCGTRTFNDGKWHNIMGVFDRTNNKFDCYGDGLYAGTVVASVSGSIYEGQSRIGAPFCCGSTFTGLLDDTRLYAQTLTASDAKQIYADGIERLRLAGIMDI